MMIKYKKKNPNEKKVHITMILSQHVLFTFKFKFYYLYLQEHNFFLK